MKFRIVSIAVVCLAASFLAFAQEGGLLVDRIDLEGPNHVRHTPSASSGMIDGAVNPERIPDSIAYRLFLIAVSDNVDATPERKARQLAFLRAADLEDRDIQSVVPILAKFKAQYEEFVQRFNESVALANTNHQTFEAPALLKERDDIVQFTRDALASALNPDAMNRLHAHVQREKARMKIPAAEAQ